MNDRPEVEEPAATPRPGWFRDLLGAAFRRPLNAFITLSLLLQAVAGLKLLCPPRSIEALAPLRIACNPTLWPFLEYNMYNGSHERGARHRLLRMYAVLEDGRRIAVKGEDFGMTHRAYHETVVSRLTWEAPEEAVQWAVAYRTFTQRRPLRFEVERQFLFVEVEGKTEGPVKVIRQFDVSAALSPEGGP